MGRSSLVRSDFFLSLSAAGCPGRCLVAAACPGRPGCCLAVAVCPVRPGCCLAAVSGCVSGCVIA